MDFDKSVGPQINFDKSYLCMMTDVCKIKQDQVTLKNTGSTTVTYEWKKIERGDYIPSKKSDGVQRFYCHYPRDTLKPGEQKTFIFSFRSEKPGMFNEEWELLTEPQLLEPAPLLYLSGMATKADDYTEKRTHLNSKFEKELAQLGASYDAQETPAEIKQVPAPDAEQGEVNLEKKFESFNEHLGLYFTQTIYDNFVQVYNMVVQRLQVQGTPDNIKPFEIDVEYIEEIITRIQNPYTQESLQRKYVENFYKAKKVPTSRAQSYDIFRALVLNYSEDVIDIDEKVRRDLQLTENLGFEIVAEEQTQEEADAALEDLKSKKAEAAKKLKQKPKTEEEETAELESLIAKTAQELGQSLCVDSEKVKAAEKEIELIKTRWLMQNHLKMDKDAYDAVNRKLSIYDIELGARDIILRLDLDIPLSKFQAPLKANDMLSHKSLDAPASVGKDSKLNVKNSELGSVVSASPLGAEEDYWRQRQILDHSWVKKTVQELRMLMERMVNRVFIIGNLGEKHGKIKGENSMKIIQHELAQHIHDVPIHLLADGNKSDFIERKQQDEFADNCIYVVENLNFSPEEFGYIEPVPKVEAPPVEVDEAPKEELSQPKDSKGKASKKEDSKVLESQQVTQEVVEVVEAVEEEQEPVPEPFNAHTIHQFKKNLGTLGEIYINDAPLASLTNSTTTSEIKCAKKVMGMKMTEEMRNIAQFFMKEMPLDIDSIYHKKPDSNLEYYTIKSSAIIGGICSSTSDIIEKILLANSFLDSFSKIFLVGEIGIAAIHALGLETGKVERSSDNKAEYDMMKEFFIKLFEKSVEKGVEIKVPVDFVTAEKQTLEEIQADVAEKEAAGAGQEVEQNAEAQSKPKTGEQTSGVAGQLDISEVQKVQNDMEILSAQGKSGTGPQYDSNFKPNHWTDAQIFYKRVQNIDLEAQIYKSFDMLTEKTRHQMILKQQSLASSGMDLKIAEASLRDLGSVGSAPINVVSPEEPAPTESKEGAPPIAETQEEGEENQVQSPEEPGIAESQCIIAFGPKTVYALQEAIKLSFKMFWDGSVSMFFNDTILSSVNNKDVLNTLLDMRTKTNDHEDPPVTLLHGQETEKVLRMTLMRIKIEQQEALEAKKRAAEEYVPEEEDDEENEDEMEDLADESEEKISTFQEDLDIITDFSCFSSSEFTTKIMQGVNLKCMLNLEEHTKPSKEQMEENLSILDAI